MREEQAIKSLEDVRTQNAIVDEVLDSIRKENPQFDVIFSRVIGWWWFIKNEKERERNSLII